MMHKRSTVLAALALALLALPQVSSAQGVPSDSLLRGFEPSGDYVLMVNGKPVGAEVYYQSKVPAILVMSSALPSPVLLMPGQGTVETVHIMKIAKQKNGNVDLLADAVLAPIGQFAGENAGFTYEGRKVSLNPKPPLVGLHRGAELKQHNPMYARTANAYTPNGAAIASLKKGPRPVTVRVYFGSWCPHCRQLVPLILKVEDQLQGSPVKFEYFGLQRPPDAWKDPEVKRVKVNGVPTGIVYRDGKEIGRISDWEAPEVSLNKIINGTAQAAKGK